MLKVIAGLRFVKREVIISHAADGTHKLCSLQRIAQQRTQEIWFEVQEGVLVMCEKMGEWEDVPVQEELDGN